MNNWPIALLILSMPAVAVEKAAYDSTGRIIALLSDAEDLEVGSQVMAVLPTGKRIPLQSRRDRTPIRRERGQLAWSGTLELPDGGAGRFELKADEAGPGLQYSVAVTAETALQVEAIELVLDLPRPVFVNGKLRPGSGDEMTIPAVKPANAAFYRGETSRLSVTDPSGKWILDLKLTNPRVVAVVDHWDARSRCYQVRASIQRGALERGATAALSMGMELRAKPATGAPARLALDASQARYRFDGFGGDYCWSNESPAAVYTIRNLKIAWARTEMKLLAWDKERDHPGPGLRADLEMMQRFQKMGVPYVISIWWMPERLYADPYEKPRSAHFRRIAADKWDDTLELVGSYLLYAKREYGVEPDLFSFNEANIGIYVGFSPEDHTDAIKRFGAHFRKLGLKTKLLLGDATGPRDTHTYVLAAAADAEAMQFVGAVGFHSWGGATREQYTAWGDVGAWLQLPLLVTELGVDAAAYHTRSWDSYHYGLREARMVQEIMLYARPQGTQFWQFTNDYSLVRTGPDGTVEPTSRFWLMKHFTDLTPQKSEVLGTSSDQATVLFTAFRRGCDYALHVLNLGGAREVAVKGLPEVEWRATATTESEHFQGRDVGRAVQGSLQLAVAARSLMTLTGRGCGAGN